MSETNDDLAVLRQYAAQIQQAEDLKPARDREILRLRSVTNPATGKPWTWEQIKEAANLSRIAAIDASKRAAKDRAA